MLEKIMTMMRHFFSDTIPAATEAVGNDVGWGSFATHGACTCANASGEIRDADANSHSTTGTCTLNALHMSDLTRTSTTCIIEDTTS